MKKLTISTLIVTSTIGFNTAMADDLLDRLEVATEQIGENQGKFYVSRVPELAEKLPEWEWDDEIRSANKCVLDGIEEEKGREIAEAYVTGLEIDAKIPITSMAQLSDQNNIPPVLRDGQTLIALSQKCNIMEISAARLKESGFWDEMMNPEVMEKLVGE